MKPRSIRIATTLLATTLLLAAACSSDESGGGSTGGDGGSGGASGGQGAQGGAASGGAAGNGGTPSGGTGGADGGTTSGGAGGASSPGDAGPDAACDGYVHPGTLECIPAGDVHDFCITSALEVQPGRRVDRADCDVGCFCGSCQETFSNCGLDPDCQSILLCAADTGCTGLNCYTPATCQGVIDGVGGVLGDAGQLAVAFLNCQQAAACAPTCDDGDAGADASAGDAGGDGG